MKSLTMAEVCGSWRVVRTEIPPPYNPEHEFFHVFPDGLFVSEQPFLKQTHKTFRFRYELSETGARLITLKGSFYSELRIRREGDLLVFTPQHGYSSWLELIAAHDRPTFLTLFCERPGTTNEAEQDRMRRQ